MFIQTEATADPARLKFLPGREVMAKGAVTFRDKSEAARSPLAERLFAIAGVSAVSLDRDSILVTAGGDWRHLKPAILGAIMEHFVSGAPILYQSGGETPRPSSSSVEDKDEVTHRVKDALRQVIDPELGHNIVDLGFIYDIVIEGEGVAHIIMTTTTPGCPATNYLKQGAAEAASDVAGIEFVDVTLTYEPRWTPEMISPEAKAHLGIGNGGSW
jgi:metal-sulfur cluster biosynthetic enzyme